MTDHKKTSFYNIAALICAIWFLLTSWLWTYGMNLFISYPVGLLGLFFWNKDKQTDPESRLSRISFMLLLAGLAISLMALLIMFVYN
ncbi:MAG TPA: hypothetical protein PLR06_06215 [Cyclobacteriaceae bacterium]|nr:hypothetical protein [Cyclobacteriaceae bacterium]